MALLTNNTPIKINAGRHIFKVVITSGTVDLQFNPDGVGFSTITDGSFSASADGVVDLPQNCTFQAVISDTAVVSLLRTSYNG